MPGGIARRIVSRPMPSSVAIGMSPTQTGIGFAQIVVWHVGHVRGYESGSGYFVPQ
jgi:hypothetical protein